MAYFRGPGRKDAAAPCDVLEVLIGLQLRDGTPKTEVVRYRDVTVLPPATGVSAGEAP